MILASVLAALKEWHYIQLEVVIAPIQPDRQQLTGTLYRSFCGPDTAPYL